MEKIDRRCYDRQRDRHSSGTDTNTIWYMPTQNTRCPCLPGTLLKFRFILEQYGDIFSHNRGHFLETNLRPGTCYWGRGALDPHVHHIQISRKRTAFTRMQTSTSTTNTSKWNLWATIGHFNVQCKQVDRLNLKKHTNDTNKQKIVQYYQKSRDGEKFILNKTTSTSKEVCTRQQ